jgi:hypothetical protein
MKFIEIEQTSKTPYVLFDEKNGLLTIEGRCITENALDFFNDLQKILSEYEKDPGEILTLIINLEYFNTASAKELMEIFHHLSQVPSKVIWCYEEKDTDMLEIGEDFEQMFKKIPFIFKIIER